MTLNSLSGFGSLSARLVASWRLSPLLAGLRWWSAQLLACLPESWRTRLDGYRQPRWVHWPLQPQVCAGQNNTITLLMPACEVLLCPLTLPAQAVRNLKAIVSFELDKYTPFTRDEVCFDALVDVVTPGKPLAVTLVVIKRSRLLSALDDARAQGLAVGRVDAADAAGQPLGIDLSSTLRSAASTRLPQLRLAASLMALLLVVLLALSWVSNRQLRLETMRQEIAELRVQAKQVDTLRRQLQLRVDTEKTLELNAAKRRNSLALLDALTRCINVDTWLEELQVHADGQVRISGLSRKASELPSQLANCAHLVAPTFQGGVQPDHNSTLEHFTLQATRQDSGA